MSETLREDRQLLNSCLEGDREALGFFVRRFPNLVYRLGTGIAYKSFAFILPTNTVSAGMSDHLYRRAGSFPRTWTNIRCIRQLFITSKF